MCILLAFLQKTWVITIMNPLLWFMIIYNINTDKKTIISTCLWLHQLLLAKPTRGNTLEDAEHESMTLELVMVGSNQVLLLSLTILKSKTSLAIVLKFYFEV